MRPFPVGAFGNSMTNVTRRRKLGLNPMVTSASAPDFTKTRRSIKDSQKKLQTDYGLLPAVISAFDFCPTSSLRQQSAMPLVLRPQSSILVPLKLRRPQRQSDYLCN